MLRCALAERFAFPWHGSLRKKAEPVEEKTLPQHIALSFMLVAYVYRKWRVTTHFVKCCSDRQGVCKAARKLFDRRLDSSVAGPSLTQKGRGRASTVASEKGSCCICCMSPAQGTTNHHQLELNSSPHSHRSAAASLPSSLASKRRGHHHPQSLRIRGVHPRRGAFPGPHPSNIPHGDQRELERSRRPLPSWQEDRRGFLWGHIRGFKPHQSAAGRDQVCTC